MKTDTNRTVGQRFKAYRLQKGLSQSEVTEGICSYSLVSHLENDRSIPSPKIMGKLAERLGVTLRDIMGKMETGLDADFQVDLIRVYIELEDYAHALDLVQALNRRDDLYEHQRYEVLVSYAKCLIKLKDPSAAIELIQPYLEQYERQNHADDDKLCTLYNILGNAHYESNDMTNAFSCYMRAYSITLKFSKFDLLAADVAYNCGMICNQLGMSNEAGGYLSKAHKFYSSVSDLKHLADTFFHLAIATQDEQLIQQALSIYQSLNIVKKAHLARQYYAYNIKSKSDYIGAAEDLYRTAIEFEKLQDLEMCVYTLATAGMICLDQMDVGKAEEFLAEASRRAEQIQSTGSRRLAFYKFVQARYYFLCNEYRTCIELGEESSMMFSKIGMSRSYADAMYLVAEAYGKLGFFEKAYQLQKQVSDTLFRHEVKRK